MNLLESALNYARRGIPVFPVHGINDNGACTCNNPDCTHPGKHPILTGGYKNATLDERQIIEWCNKYPQANIGIPTGEASGWYVIDVDKKNNGIKNYREFLDQHETAIPKASLKVNTGGGGYHLIYAKPANGQTVKSTTSIGRMEGVDFRGEGGYIVAPPSLHYSQEIYQWARGFTFDGHYDPAQLEPLPAVIADLVNNPTKALINPKSIPQGSRNDTLFKLACQARRDGVTDDKLFDRVSAENESTCKPPLEQTEVQQIVDSALKQLITPETKIKTGKPKSSSGDTGSYDAFNKVFELTSEHEFWVDEYKKAYVTFPIHNNSNQIMHYENWPIQSKVYRDFLRYRYRQRYKEMVSSRTLNNILERLAGDVLFGGNCYKTHIRTAWYNDCIIIDMTDEDWRWIEITAAGYRICNDKPPVKFLRSPNVRPMFTPDPTGSFECLPEIFHLKSQGDYKLLAGWLMFVLVPGGPYPVLIIEGVAGSSKSTLTIQISQLVDPKISAVQGTPPNTDDLFIKANNGHLIALDNLSTINQPLSNVLCGIATGTGASKRELYTDTGEVYFEVCRPIVLNSINPVVSASDLADRSIRLSLPPITARRSAEEVDAKFLQYAPKILGAICNAIRAAMSRYKRVQGIPSEIRMIDFAQWGFAAGDVLGWSSKDFIQVLLANRQHNAAPFMEDNMLNMAVLKGISKNSSYNLRQVRKSSIFMVCFW